MPQSKVLLDRFIKIS